MARILFTEPINLENLKPFQETKHEIFFPKEEIKGVHEFDRSALIQTIKDLKPDVLVVGLKFQLNEEILSAWPGIDVVATRTSGLDHLDLDYCEKHSIAVLSLRGEDLSDVSATAEWTFLNMGMLLRKTGHELNGKTLGLIGYGRISKMMQKYAEAFNMHVKIYDKFQGGILTDVLNCDIVSLHITADEENRGFMRKGFFEEMKQGSWFLNSSRDWLVDNVALQEALESGKLADAWSDFPEHQGGKGIESSIKTEKIIINKLLQWLS